jgi:hypothetical protein
MYSRNTIFFIIIFSFIVSSLLSCYYVLKYDRIVTLSNGNETHSMIKIALNNPWAEADKILKDIKSGKNFFSSGDAQYDEFLPSKILALYYYLIKQDLYDYNGNIKTNNNKLGYILIKTFFYYLTLFYFSKKIIKILPLKNCFFVITFLSLMPDIMQYHHSFWNESLAFPLQILILCLFVEYSKKVLINFNIGVIISFITLISQEFLLYIIPIIFLQIIFFRKKSIRPILATISGYLIILVIVFFYNLQFHKHINLGVNGIKTAPYLYLIPKIFYKNYGDNFNNIILNEDKDWSKKNNINILFNDNSLIGNVKGTLEDQNKYYNYLFLKSLKIIITNPFTVLGVIFDKTLHAFVLNPVYVHYFYEYDSRGSNTFLDSQTHKKLIPIRIFYSLFFYVVVFIGFLKSLSLLKKEHILLLSISYFYIILTMGWMGIPRYFVPSLIFLSIFFGNGITAITDFKYKKF